MKTSLLSLIFGVVALSANAGSDFTRVFPSDKDVSGFLFKVEAKSNDNGTTHFIVKIVDKNEHFPESVEFSLCIVKEKNNNIGEMLVTKLKALRDGNSATCVFDAADIANLSFVFSDFISGRPSEDMYYLVLKDFTRSSPTPHHEGR